MNKLLLGLLIFICFNNNAMRPPIYLGNWQNKTTDDIVVTFSTDQGDKTVIIPTGQSDAVLINKKLSSMQSLNNAGNMAVVGIEKLTASDDDAYKRMSVLLALALSDEMQVFTSVVLPPVQVSEKARTFLNLVETPAPLGINFDGIIEDSETSFDAIVRTIN